MKKILLVLICCIQVALCIAQNISAKLAAAFQQFQNDSQLKHAVSSLYVVDGKTGKVIFDKNSQVGLAPASTQKIITSATAFELLGKEYCYKTELGYDGNISNNVLKGNLYVIGSGDPTLGSTRWQQTKDSFILRVWTDEVKKLKIQKIDGSVVTNTSKFSYQAIPDGWIWQDIGNYYGAGSYPLNWKENQYDLYLTSGNTINDKVKVVDSSFSFDANELKSAARGTGDNAYIFYDKSLTGTIPIGEKSFSISGATIDPVAQLLLDFKSSLLNSSIASQAREGGYQRKTFNSDSSDFKKIKFFYKWHSPSLDSIVYWFMRKSINLYGEALIKTLAYEKNGYGATDAGVKIVKDFWKQKGIDEYELNICDGSGLSPLNRVTTHAQVEVLKFAKDRDWFPYFYAALPEYNGMKMKSGTITDAKAFCGYQNSKDGNEYIFSLIISNYNGRTSELVNKMYRVLDILK